MALESLHVVCSRKLTHSLDVDRAEDRSILDEQGAKEPAERYAAQTSRELTDIVSCRVPGEVLPEAGPETAGEKHRARRRSSAARTAAAAAAAAAGDLSGQHRRVGTHGDMQTPHAGPYRPGGGKSAASGVAPVTAAQNALVRAKLAKFQAMAGSAAETASRMDGIKAPSLTGDLNDLAQTIKALRTSKSNGPMVDLESDYEVEDFIAESETRCYRLPFLPGCIGFKVVLRAQEGDPDLYVCQQHQKPDKEHHTWRSASEGVDVVHVPAGNSVFQPKHVYIGINGHSKSTYRLKATWIENKQSRDIADEIKRGFKKTAQARVAEKIESQRMQYRQQAAPRRARRARALRPGEDSYGKFGAKFSLKARLLKDLAAIRDPKGDEARPRPPARDASGLGPIARIVRGSPDKLKWRGMGNFAAGKVQTAAVAAAAPGIGGGQQAHAVMTKADMAVLQAGRHARKQRKGARPAGALPALRAEGLGSAIKTAALERELSECRRRSQLLNESLGSTFISNAVVTELGGLALEAPVRSKDRATQRELFRAQGGVSLQALNEQGIGLLGTSEEEMKTERKLVTANRHYSIFRHDRRR